MCGRYYIDDNTSKEIEKLLLQTEEKLRRNAVSTVSLQSKDIRPTEMAPVLAVLNENSQLCCRMQRWGFVAENGQFNTAGRRIIFNARSETAAEKPMFSESLAYRRVVIPAAWFYEWNRSKEKNIFYSKDRKVLYMAGFYRCASDGERFVILTTQANESMKPVHDRMPVLLEEEEILPWILEPEKTQAFLVRKPSLLDRKSEYEQLSLFSY